MNFDLNILPLFRQEGHDRLDMPGVHVAMPPRKATRVRSDDRLIIFLHFEGKGVVLRDQLKQLLYSIENSFYSRSGTITATLQAIITEINDILLEQNLKLSVKGQQASAYLSMAVMRNEMLYIAQSGRMHGFVIGEDTIEHLYDASSDGRGLGLSRNNSVRFYQTELQAGKLLVFLPNLPAGWNQNTLKTAHGQQLGILRRRFLSDAGLDLKALVVETVSGAGDLYLLTPENNAESIESLAAEVQHSEGFEPVQEQELIHTRPATMPANAPSTQVSGSLPNSSSLPAQTVEIGEPGKNPPAIKETPLISKRTFSDLDIKARLLKALEKLRLFSNQAFGKMRRLMLKMMPDEEEFKLSSSMMALIAVIIPILVVAAAALIYARVGLNRQYSNYYALAENALLQSQAASEVVTQHDFLTKALTAINQAEEYDITDESTGLHAQIQGLLDTQDLVSRIEFQPAISGSINNSVKIKRMVATGRDLYLLDANSGSVMRAWLSGSGYKIDLTFSCGPGRYGPYIVSSIVDIAPLPRDSQQNASLVGMDGNGNLIYCQADSAPYAMPLATPYSNWGEPLAISIANGNLYVLDPITNAVWMYYGEGDKFTGVANFYFKEQVPDLQSAIDMSILQDDMYILHQDGHTTHCVYNNLDESGTNCEDPALLKDERPGRENAPSLSDARFFQLNTTQPPEPSVYYLDPISGALYHFTLKLNLVQQLRPQTELPPGVITAFAISPTRSIFIAKDNQVFLSFLP